MALNSWAVPAGLGLLAILGCSSPRPEAPDAALPHGDAGIADAKVADARPDATAVPDAAAVDASVDAGTSNPIDPNLPPEPVIPPACAGATLDAPHAVRATGDVTTDGLPIYDLAALDTAAIQAAIDACGASLTPGVKGSVRLQVNATDSTHVAFVSGPVFLRAGVTLWIDRGVTLFAAQDPRLYDARGVGTCGTDANNNSNGCLSLINVNGPSATALLADAGVMGDGVIDGLGGEPMVGGFNGNPNGTWWDVAQHARPLGTSHSNPRLIDVLLANRFTLYRVTLRNSPKFHVGLESDNYLVWGVTVQTPSRAVNSVGRKLTASYARNTDGIDPSDSWNGTIAYSRISVGDDQIAIKCGKYHLNASANADQPSCRNLTVAHTQFGTGHGMSIGSETNGGPREGETAHPRIGMAGLLAPDGQTVATWGLHVYDLTIDASVGTGGAVDNDINGIRIKSDVSRGGLVKDVLYEDVCLRNLPNPIVLNPHYDPTKTGTQYPTYQNIILRNIHAVASTGGTAPPATPVVTLLGLDQPHRTTATLDNVVIDDLGPASVVAQYAGLTLGPGPVNFTPSDTVSPPGSPSTVEVTRVAGSAIPPVACGDRFTVRFPDFGSDASLDNNASLARLEVTADGAAAGLSPGFASGVTSYVATVPFASQRLTITPTAGGARTITVAQDGGAPVRVATGDPVPLAALAPGAASLVTVRVTAEDGTTTTSYTVTLTRSQLFGDGFEAGSGLWDLLPIAGPNGTFSVASDGTSVLKYTAGTTGGVLALVKDAAWSGVTTGDYYVEARIKPQVNGTTGNKQLYLIARYQDPANWYAAGLNVQSSTASTQVEIAKMSGGSLARPGQVKRPIMMDTWYTVRFELIGPNLSVYLDGELLRTVIDTAAFTSGKIGLYTANKSFEIDDVRVGDPRDRPVQLTISPNTDWAAEAGDAPRVIAVNAQKPDQATGTYVPDTFTVASSDATVVSVAVSGTTVTLTPLQAGTAVIQFRSGSVAALTRSITATISPAFVQSTTVYPLAGRTTPVAREPAAYIDTRLTLQLDSPPTLGTAGSIRIFRKRDDALVDVIRVTGETDAIGFPGQDQVRVVNVEGLITLAGNTATIVLHHARLAYDTEYYVAIADGVLAGTSLGGVAFDGIGRAGDWSFTTRSPPAAGLTSLVVDDDGPADFCTVQGALDHVMKNAGRDTPVTIHVRDGTYQELLFLRGKNNVTIVGDSRDGVILQYRNYETLNSGSGASQVAGSGTAAGGRAVFLLETSDLVTLDTLTLRNTMLRSTTASSQAETLYFSNDSGRLIARNASFLSEQDTLQLKGYAWFHNSLIAGNVDFIWGSNRVAVFEASEIRSVGDTANTTGGGYVVQARTVSAADKGFVFLNSRLTHGPGPGPLAADVPLGSTYLARSPGLSTSDDNIAFVNCQMDGHIIPTGWAYNVGGQPIPNPAIASAASGWREYGTTDLSGLPVNLAVRLGGYVLSDSEYATGFASRAQIFAAFGGGAGWNPQP